VNNQCSHALKNSSKEQQEVQTLCF
jgi:hypothetical protein